MPYQYILANLLARNEGAVGVLFVDDSGETVELACAEFTPFQMRVVGAYVGIYLRQMQQYFGEAGHGDASWMHIEKDRLHIFVSPLPDGYFLVLVQRTPALSAVTRRSLAAACEQLTRELFAST